MKDIKFDFKNSKFTFDNKLSDEEIKTISKINTFAQHIVEIRINAHISEQIFEIVKQQKAKLMSMNHTPTSVVIGKNLLEFLSTHMYNNHYTYEEIKKSLVLRLIGLEIKEHPIDNVLLVY